jgi:hypothetical protein
MAPEEIFSALEEEVRREWRRKCLRVTFWGTMIVDPNYVFVTQEQAERSMKELERLVQTEEYEH